MSCVDGSLIVLASIVVGRAVPASWIVITDVKSFISSGLLPTTERLIIRVSKEYHEAAEWFVSEQGNKPTFRHYEKILEKLCWAEHKATECGAAKGYVTVSPDGTIYACHREGDTEVGHLAYGFDEEARYKWLDNRFYGKPCIKCWARHICGGGCRYNAIHCNGDIKKPDTVGCFFMKTWIKECLWIMTQLNHAQLIGICPDRRKK